MSGVEPAPPLLVSKTDVEFIDRGKRFSALSITLLKAEPGKSLALTGPSGSGKSTLLYTIAGLLRPANGRVLWGGRNILALNEPLRDKWRREHVGFVFQDFELLPELTALQNVLVPATFARFAIDAKTRTRARDLLDEFGVPARGTPAGALSRGERQRVALARAMLFDPPIVLADEPTASLDANAGSVVIRALTARARAEGRTVIAATHDPALIESMDARVGLEHGRLVDETEEEET